MGLALAITFFSCNDSNDPIKEGRIVINSDSATLTERITKDGAGVVDIIDTSAPAGRMLAEASELPLVLVSKVAAPTYKDKTLRATHVDIDGKYAYVSYNTEGETYLGAVEIFDISDINNPKITEQAIFTQADISSIEYKNGKLYLAAAVDIDSDAPVTSPANLITVSVSGGKFSSDFKFTSLPGFVATDVVNTNSNTAVSSGNDGIIGLFDGSQNAGNSSKMEDLRAVAFGNDKLAVLSGKTGVHILDPNSLSELINIPLASDSDGAKRTLDIASDGYLYASEGASGAGIYNMTSGALIQKLAIPIRPEDVDAGDIVTNAVSVDKGLLFMANGAAGISISDVNDIKAIKQFGVLDLDGSSNFVRNEENYVFVATGFGGLQILKINKEEAPTGIACEGLPAYSGSTTLNINGGESKAFSGATSFKTINNNSNFKFCGSLNVANQFNMNGGSVTEINGSFVFGVFNGNTQMNVNSKLILSGSILIYGDLNLNGGSSIEFVGTGNTITIYGKVNQSNGVKITGDFKDTEGKLK